MAAHQESEEESCESEAAVEELGSGVSCSGKVATTAAETIKFIASKYEPAAPSVPGGEECGDGCCVDSWECEAGRKGDDGEDGGDGAHRE